MKHVLILLLFAVSGPLMAQKKVPVLKSPDGKLAVSVELRDKIYFSLTHEGQTIVAPSPMSMEIEDGKSFGMNPVLRGAKQHSVNQIIESPLYKRAEIKDIYNEQVLSFRDDYQVIFRAYDDGVAYRFMSQRKGPLTVKGEEVSINFDADYYAVVPFVNKAAGASVDEQLFNSFENTYTRARLTELPSERLAFLPLLIDFNNGKKLCITEADLESYPGLYLRQPGKKNSLVGYFAAVPSEMTKGGHNELQEMVKARHPYIAKVSGPRSFPWRVMVVTAEDRKLADSDMVYKLASASRIKDFSWVRPGKVAWDWWNDWNITGVNFKSGVNTETYKHYIDFAAEAKIEYVILDEGWAVNKKADLMQIVPEIDLAAIVQHATQKGVGIILWAGYNAFNREIEKVCSHYAAMGIKGFKVDFMDRDDQPMVDFYYRAAEIAARHKMMLDFHGAFKPAGLNRTYPNVINFEGVHGLEQMKWSAPSVDQVTYDVTIPFIRMIAGPMDYTQGAMRNATKENYRPVYSEPMSQGTRCRQLAQYVVFEAPLNMLCDNPTSYRKEPESTGFISAIPTTWDNTFALDGIAGEFVTIARQKGGEYYIGGMTNWSEREVEVDLSFLPAGKWEMEMFSDGINATRNAHDYKREVTTLTTPGKIKILMAPGGGFAARIRKL